MKFVLATQNPKKLKEMSAILGELGVEVVSEADLGVKIEVEETGETFAENSLLKAKARHGGDESPRHRGRFGSVRRRAGTAAPACTARALAARGWMTPAATVFFCR